jgi:hypothetical protein
VKLVYFETCTSYDVAVITLFHLNVGVQLTPVAPIVGERIGGGGTYAPVSPRLKIMNRASKPVAVLLFITFTS